jgi:transglutaminase-like putative cysteine protease
VSKTGKKDFKVRYDVLFDSRELNNEVLVWLARPADGDLQEISSFSVSPSDASSYQDDQGNEILFFRFIDTDKVHLRCDINVTLWKESGPDLELSELHQVDPGKYERYLKSEPFLEQEDEVIKKTKEVTKGCQSTIEIVRAIFNFVVDNFSYCYPVKRRGVKNLNINNLKGDCGEYSSLFVTMCRVMDIPAVNKSGFYIAQNGVLGEHGWASVYVPQIGWFDVDAQFGAQEDDPEEYFLKTSDYRLTLVKGFNIPLNPPVPAGYRVDFWEDQGLPVKKGEVQILQPLFFASKFPVTFRQEVDI